MAKGFTKQEIAKITELGGTVMHDNSFARIPIDDAASIGITKLDGQTWKPFIVSCRDARYNIEKKYNADNIDEGIVRCASLWYLYRRHCLRWRSTAV